MTKCKYQLGNEKQNKKLILGGSDIVKCKLRVQKFKIIESENLHPRIQEMKIKLINEEIEDFYFLILSSLCHIIIL